MDSKKIQAILMAVERGSLTAAAAELGYTQSGLTHMMNALEEELGLNLLVRGKNGVRFSPAGKELLPRMQALLDASDELERGAEQLRERNFSTLRLGAYSSVARGWIPSILASFRRSSPDTDVVMDVGGNEDLYEKLKNDQLDCAIVSFREGLGASLRYVPLARDRLVAVLPPDTPLENGRFPLAQFAGKEFLMPSFGFDQDILPLFERGLENTAARVRVTRLDDAAIVSMVEHGLGVSILSELIMEDMSGKVLAAPLEPDACRRLGIVFSERRESDRNVRRFVHCAQSVVEELYRETL